MFSRKYPDTTGTQLPQDWTDKARTALNTRFEAFKEQYEFFVYAEVLPDELVLITSAVKRDVLLSPITFFISVDISDQTSPKKSTKILGEMMDITELFFEETFEDENWSDYTPLWLETFAKEQNYFYKVTRENIYLTIEANKLLEGI